LRFPFDLSSGKEFDAVGFGLNAVDYLIVAPEFPQFDTKTRFLEFAQAAGGQTATAMVGLQRLGLRTSYAGRFGSDREGEFGLQSLRDEDVDTEFVEIIEDSRTQTAFIIIDARTGERTILWDRDRRLNYSENDAPLDFGTRGRILHLDAHDPAACALVARAARASGTIVSVDVDNIYNRLPELLPLTDVLISSSEFPKRLTGIADERGALMEIKARYGCPVVGMTRGVRGAIILCDGIFIECPAFAVPGGCRDTTGAGDAFHAGFLYGLLTNETIEASLRMGCAVASLKCRALGARTALPSLAELKDFLASGELMI
jgi:sulfofructose kinase